MERFATNARASTIAIGAGLIAATAHAQMPPDRPFSMRGVELGITIDQFREVTIPDEDDRYSNHQAACSNGEHPKSSQISPTSEDKAVGVVECKWYSSDSALRSNSLWEHWTYIGKGGGWPTFRFIESEGELRLFQITFYANNQYHPDILDALSRGYGDPVKMISPFQTRAGGEFTSLTSVWDNGLSSITLVERCGHLDRYCLTYEHSEIATNYHDRREAMAADAASRI